MENFKGEKFARNVNLIADFSKKEKRSARKQYELINTIRVEH